jgi:hypothetical protein
MTAAVAAAACAGDALIDDLYWAVDGADCWATITDQHLHAGPAYCCLPLYCCWRAYDFNLCTRTTFLDAYVETVCNCSYRYSCICRADVLSGSNNGIRMVYMYVRGGGGGLVHDDALSEWMVRTQRSRISTEYNALSSCEFHRCKS